MSRDDWFRRSTWSAADQEDFFARLKRSRTTGNKAQYLRIQAVHLAEAGLHTEAVKLLNLMFREYPERIQVAAAHRQKAECLVQLGQPDGAISEFRSSLQCQREFPNVETGGWLEFPWFIVQCQLSDMYDEALSILEEFGAESKLTFPEERYKYCTIRAIIADARNDMQTAKDFSNAALQNASSQHSGFRYHPQIGLVRKFDNEIHERLVELADREV